MLRPPAPVVLACALLAGCGGGGNTPSDPPEPRLPPPPAAECRQDDGLEASQLVGERVDEARSIARLHGCILRVVRRDGEDLVVTQDFRADRANVAVVEGRVTSFEGFH